MTPLEPVYLRLRCVGCGLLRLNYEAGCEDDFEALVCPLCGGTFKVCDDDSEVREARLRDLGFDEPTDEERRENLARNLALLEIEKETP